MKNKHIIRALKLETKKLAPESYYAIEKYYQPILVDGEWKVGEVVERPRNLKRAVKKIYNKYSLDGVRAWFYVKQMNKIQNDKEKSGSSVLPQESGEAVSEGVDTTI